MSARYVDREAENLRPKELIQNVGKNGCRTECDFEKMEL
jgi:hypothetical protein